MADLTLDSDEHLATANAINNALLTPIHNAFESVAHLIPDPVKDVVAVFHLKEILLDEWVLFLVTVLPLILCLLRLIPQCCCCCSSARGGHAPIKSSSVVAPVAAVGPLPRKLSHLAGTVHPLTPQQLAAFEAALDWQIAVAAAARNASAEHKAREDARWRRNGGRAMNSLLAHGPLIDAEFLLVLAENQGVLPPYEEMPTCAKIDASSVWRLRTWNGATSLPVLVLAMPWLDDHHPDAQGAQLLSLIPILRALLSTAQLPGCHHATVGVFVPYCCFPTLQPTSGALLAARQAWLSHPCTHVLLLDAPVAHLSSQHTHTMAFMKRGWQVWEAAHATILKYTPLLWEMSRFRGGDTYEAFHRSLVGTRRPPLGPPRLATLLHANAMHFEPGGHSNADVAAAAYASGFVATFDDYRLTCPGRSQVLYTDSGWTAAEASIVAEALAYAAAHCSLPPGIFLSIHVTEGNLLAPDALELIRQAVRGSPFKIK